MNVNTDSFSVECNSQCILMRVHSICTIAMSGKTAFAKCFMQVNTGLTGFGTIIYNIM